MRYCPAAQKKKLIVKLTVKLSLKGALTLLRTVSHRCCTAQLVGKPTHGPRSSSTAYCYCDLLQVAVARLEATASPPPAGKPSHSSHSFPKSTRQWPVVVLTEPWEASTKRAPKAMTIFIVRYVSYFPYFLGVFPR